MGQLRDCEIEELISKSFDEDPRVDPTEIDVRVLNGVVYVSGIVDSAAERHAAQEDIISAVEVKGIVDQLTLRNYIERTDDELREVVKHSLMRDTDVDINKVSIEAKNGKVTLGGRLATEGEKSSVDEVAWWTPGVTDVVSNIEVEAEPGRSEIDDY